MAKKLFEAKADLESAISKSLSQSPLAISEIEELEVVSPSSLIADHGLDSIMAEIVINHLKSEKQRPLKMGLCRF